jgi:CubicO group peptidase (beta-lactamase class C family)
MPRTLPAGRLAAIDAAVERAVADGRTPGLALAVVDRDGSLAVRGYGYADVAARSPIAPDTLFEIGSIGKMFTAIAVLQLVEEGRLDLHAPVEQYLPWFRVPSLAGAAPITTHHLLSHTAGIVAGVDATPEPTFQVWSLREMQPGSTPGERFHYSNVGYKTLGLVLERLESLPYPEVIRRRILEPLEMRSTAPAINHALRPRLAVGYEDLFDDRIGHAGRPLAPAVWLETDTADGSIASTAADMGAFVRMLLRAGEGPRGRLLGEASFAALCAPHARPNPGLAYGYALLQRLIGERTFIGHGGGMVGYRSGLQADSALGIGVVVLVNGPGAAPMALAREVVDLAADRVGDGSGGGGAEGGGSADGPADGDRPSRDAGPLGHWVRDDGIASFSVTAHGDDLRLETDHGAVVIEPWGDDRYLVPDAAFDDALLWVDRQDGGPPELWHGGDRFVLEDAVPRTLRAPDADLRATVGQFRSHTPWCPVFRIVLRGDRPWLLFPAAPDGFDDEQPLDALADGSFRAGDDTGGPERLRFDTLIDGHFRRAWLSGWPYYRVGD